MTTLIVNIKDISKLPKWHIVHNEIVFKGHLFINDTFTPFGV